MIGAGRKEFDVVVQSQTNQLFQYLLLNELKTDITLTAPVAVDDDVINVSTGHGFTAVAGEHLVLRNGDAYLQVKVKSVAVNAITIEEPVDRAYPILGTSIIRGSSFMNVNATLVAPVDFKFSFNGDLVAKTPIDIQSVVLSFQSATVPDDGTFGGIEELANGLFFQKKNSININLGNYVNNQQFRDIGATIVYTDKAPSSEYATNIFIDIIRIFGQVIRLDPKAGDCLIGRVRDDGRDNTSFTVSLLGSFTSGE